MDIDDKMPLSESQAMVLDAPGLMGEPAASEEESFIGKDVEIAEIYSSDVVDRELEDRVLVELPDAAGLPPEVFNDIAETSASQRIIVIHRHDGVAYSTLFAIFAALLLDGMLLGGLYFLNHVKWSKSATVARAMGVTDRHNSTAIGGMVVSGMGHRNKPTDPLQSWRMSALPPVPQLLSLTGRSQLSSRLLLAGAMDIPQKNLVIGVAQGPDTWAQPRVPKVPRIHQRPKRHRDTHVHHIPPTIHPRSRGPRSRGPTQPGGGDSGITFNFYKGTPDLPIVGGGGRGRGGWSADSPAEPKKDPLPHLPLKYLLAGARIQIVVRVLVMPDGRVRKVKIVKSSGHPTIDHLFMGAILNHWKFLPARKNNIPIRGYWQESINLSAN